MSNNSNKDNAMLVQNAIRQLAPLCKYNGISSSVVWLSPENAKSLIAESIDGERNLSKLKVAEFDRLMKKGAFSLSWDPIVITESGTRVNANTRLNALALQSDDYRAPFLLLQGCPEDIHLIGDSGRKRSAADHAKRRFPRKANHHEREAVYNALYDLAVSSSQTVEYLERHATLDAKYSKDVEACLGTTTRAAATAAMVYALGVKKHRPLVESFVNDFQEGGRGKSYARKLREYMLQRGKDATPLECSQMMLFAIRKHIACGGKPKTDIGFGQRLKNGVPTPWVIRYDAAVDFFRAAS